MSMRHAVMILVLGLAAPAAIASDVGAHEQVLQRIILMRHGIRSPTKAPADLAKYAADPWPTWPVPPGQLTAHGIETLRGYGKRLRGDLADAKLPLDACKGEVRVIADSTPRNRASAEALLAGLAPGCAPAYQALAPGQVDPLFHGVGSGDDDDKGGIDAAAVGPSTRATLDELQQVLLGCHDTACVAKAKAAGKTVLLDGDAGKALKAAGSLAENIMLGYVQGMPPAEYGWSRLDDNGVARIIGLHNASFRLAHATPEASRGRGGNLLAHVTATLAAAAGRKGTVAPLEASGARTVVLVGHDTDLAAQAGLLGLDWHDATRGDDYPPGGALSYDLVKTSGGVGVRLSVDMPTLAALRAGDMASKAATVRKVLTQPACGNATVCPLDQFIRVTKRAAGDAVSQ